MALSFVDFRPIGFAFEIRYPEAFLLWDRAGQLANQLKAQYASSRLTSAEPGKIVFICDRTREITWQLDKLNVLDHNPTWSKLDEFLRLSEDCFKMTVGYLEVTELKRVGFRPIFAKTFPSKEAAGAELVSAGILRVPEGKQFNVDALHTLPEYSVRREGEKSGYLLRISIQTAKFEFEIPPQWELTDVPTKEENRLLFDVDWYTLAPMSVGAMRVTEWLTQVVHALRRDADTYLGK